MEASGAGRVAFVTGGAGGIGQSIAQALAHTGVAVAVADMHGEQARETARAIGAGGGQAIGVRSEERRVGKECRL